jgi:transcriptional regulator with XRE-family HTH domain
MVGEELRKARETAGLTQEELSSKARVDRSYISQLERGLKSPTLDMLLRLCKAMGVSASEIVARVEKEAEDTDAKEEKENQER